MSFTEYNVNKTKTADNTGPMTLSSSQLARADRYMESNEDY